MNIKKTYTKTIVGIAFWPAKMPEKFYPSVFAWVNAGAPNEVTVYDSVDTLKVCGISVCDAIPFNGVYRRLPKLMKPKENKITIDSIFISPIRPGKARTVVDGVFISDTKDHHKLTR